MLNYQSVREAREGFGTIWYLKMWGKGMEHPGCQEKSWISNCKWGYVPTNEPVCVSNPVFAD